MNSLRSEEQKTLVQVYNSDTIHRMIGSFEEIFPDLYSEEIFENPELLNGKSEQYLRTALEIRAAIGIYNDNSPTKFNYNAKSIDNEVDKSEERELDIQMENFKNNGPIETKISRVTQENRTGFKAKIAGLLNMLKSKNK